MTPLQTVLAIIGAVIILTQIGLLAYTVVCLLSGQRTVSGYMKTAPRWVVAVAAFGVGLIVGTVFSHFWFPTVGE